MTEITKNMSDLEKDIYLKYKEKFPFRIVEFTNDIGIDVFVDGGMPERILGTIYNFEGVYSIVLNSHQNHRRMRFTLAHELAHYFNDKEYLFSSGEITDAIQQGILASDENTTDSKASSEMLARNVCANKFATSLLMPSDLFIEKWYQMDTIMKVADFFDVSCEATIARANTLLGEII